LRFLFSIKQELGDNVADMNACSIDENLFRTPSSNAAPLEVLQWSAATLQNLPVKLWSAAATHL